MAVKYHSYPDGYIAPPLHVLQKSGLASNRNLCYTNLNMATVVSSCNLNFAFVRFPLLFGFVDCCVALDYRAGLNFLTRKFFTIFWIFFCLKRKGDWHFVLFSSSFRKCLRSRLASDRPQGRVEIFNQKLIDIFDIFFFFFCNRRGGTCPEPISTVNILLGSPVWEEIESNRQDWLPLGTRTADGRLRRLSDNAWYVARGLSYKMCR